MKTIATICARGGSTGVPRKNILPLLGKPLILYSIEQALECPEIEEVFVSTDDQEIAGIAKEAGATVPFIRPSSLATNSAPKIPVLEHLIDFLLGQGIVFSRIVDLDPTSPLRELRDIQACLSLLDVTTDVVITGYESEKNPYFNMVERLADGGVCLVKPPASPIAGRQAAPCCYAMNGSVYVWHANTLHLGLWDGRARIHVMPRERSIDIDSWLDFQIVELLMQKNLDGRKDGSTL